MENPNWEKHSAANSPEWEYFLRSHHKNPQTQRYRAQCNSCKVEFDGRVYLLKRHLTDDCKGITPDDKFKYLRDSQKAKTPSLETHTTTAAVPTTNYFKPLSNETIEQLRVLLLKSFVNSNIPFRFANDPFFIEYQNRLARSVYNPPSAFVLSTNTLPKVHSEFSFEQQQNLLKMQGMTISLDGWTDSSGTSVYALVLLQSDTFRTFGDVLELFQKRHSAVNLFAALEETFQRLPLAFSTCRGIVTDNPSVMLCLRELVCQKYPWIISLRCCLHSWNLMAKDFCKVTAVQETIKKTLKLVNFFSSSTFWKETLQKWRAVEGVKHSLQTFFETRWFSIFNVCKGAAEHELGFSHCFQLSRSRTIDTPTLPEKIVDLIQDKNYWTTNTVIL
eukprot:Pompholyxophrys_punicea_v1_NODE_277_length_2406_cov_4.192684.p1 type:complete len:389 gc:universal NODE_277_length_2406_cov_4.192684:249-1415(+)